MKRVIAVVATAFIVATTLLSGPGAGAASSGGTAYGFVTYDPGAGLTYRHQKHYVLRLVSTANTNVDVMRVPAQAAVDQVAAISGVRITVAPGTVPDGPYGRDAVAGEILLSLRPPTAGCPAGGGCGVGRTLANAGVATVVGGYITLDTVAANYSLDDRKAMAAHELGHVLGLAHFNSVFEGKVQVMNSSGGYEHKGQYQSGDRNGIFALRPTTATPAIGAFRPGTHTFYLRSATGAVAAYDFGVATDVPVTGDWDNDGIDDIGVFRPSNHTFYLRLATGSVGTHDFGESTDIPVIGDWNSDGSSDIGVYRPGNQTFYLRQPNGTFGVHTVGDFGDKPIAGDWDNDGIFDIGVFRPSNHTFYLRLANGYVGTHDFGESTDIPVIGDWNSDGSSDIGVYRPGNKSFYLRDPSGSFGTHVFGNSGDKPIGGSW